MKSYDIAHGEGLGGQWVKPSHFSSHYDVTHTCRNSFLPVDHIQSGLIQRCHTFQSTLLNLFQLCTSLNQKFQGNCLSLDYPVVKRRQYYKCLNCLLSTEVKTATK